MLSVFPDLLPYGLLAATVVRISVGIVLIYFGTIILISKKNLLIQKLSLKGYPLPKIMAPTVGASSILVGCFLFAGFLTQISCLVAAYLFLNLLVIDRGAAKVLNQNWLFYSVMILVSLSLLFSGAGAFAVDWPI